MLPSSNLLSININEDLFRNLDTKEWGRPLALPTVVQESIQRKDMIPLKEFLSSTESIYRNPWSLNPLNLLGWGLRQLGVTGGFSLKVATGQFVVLQNLEDAGKELIRRTKDKRGRVERIYTRKQFTEFRDVVQGQHLSDKEMELLLRFLQRDKGILVYDAHTVKFIHTGEPASITHEDSTVASLKSLIRDLEHQTKVLEKKVDDLTIAARDAVSRKNKVSALAALRSKKLTSRLSPNDMPTCLSLKKYFLRLNRPLIKLSWSV